MDPRGLFMRHGNKYSGRVEAAGVHLVRLQDRQYWSSAVCQGLLERVDYDPPLRVGCNAPHPVAA